MPNKIKKTKREPTGPDDFESVAKRLGCDPDLKAFDKKLGKIAKTAAQPQHKTEANRK